MPSNSRRTGGFERLVRALEVTLVLMLLAVLVGSLLGQPVLLGYVQTDSMQPVIDPGDGFVAIPSAITPGVEEGDVVVFDAEELQGGGLTTHRVVGVTGEGYITQGDANPSTDQAGGEPPVRDAQVVAQALQIDGQVVTIPHLGTVVTEFQSVSATIERQLAGTFGFGGRQSIAVLLFAAATLGYAWDVWREHGSANRERIPSKEVGTNVQLYVLVFVGVLVLAATAAMVLPAGPTEFGFVSSSHPTSSSTVVGAGETGEITYELRNSGSVPIVALLESEGGTIDVEQTQASVGAGETKAVAITLSAPRETGYYRPYLVEHRYLAVLPTGVIHSLYEIHPWLPIVVIDALIGIPLYLLGVRLVGTGRLRTRNRDRPITTDARRAIRRLYQ